MLGSRSKTMTYYYKGFKFQTSWIHPRILLSDNARKHFGRNRPKEIDDSNMKTIHDKLNIQLTRVAECDGSDVNALNGQKGLFAIKKIAKNKNGEVVFGLYLSTTEYNLLCRRSEVDHDKYAVSLTDDNGVTWIVIPNYDNKDNWVFCNDGWRPDDSNKSNCYFSWQIVNKLPIIFIKSKKTIKTGDQLLVKYGNRYWKKHAEKN